MVHGILTTDNLFDGTITTKFEHYYIEPSSKYSKDLHGNGVHSIVYKASDVEQPVHRDRKEIREEHIDVADDFVHHCASERLNRNLKAEMKKERAQRDKRSKSNVNIFETKIRQRRFLPDEVSKLFYYFLGCICAIKVCEVLSSLTLLIQTFRGSLN